MLSWRQKRDLIFKLIKQVSDENGGDDIEWLREYAKNVVRKYADNMDVLIDCFDSLTRKEAKCIVSLPASIGELMVP